MRKESQHEGGSHQKSPSSECWDCWDKIPELLEGHVRLFCQNIFPLLPISSVSSYCSEGHRCGVSLPGLVTQKLLSPSFLGR